MGGLTSTEVVASFMASFLHHVFTDYRRPNSHTISNHNIHDDHSISVIDTKRFHVPAPSLTSIVATDFHKPAPSHSMARIIL